MKKLSIPPRIKVLEALSTIGDNRIQIVSEKEARVKSSDGKREYKVFLDIEKKQASSNDNGTYYKGYIGYPIIAFLMVKGLLPFDAETAEKLRGFNWREMNEKYKSYRIVETLVKKAFRERGGDVKKLDELVDNIMKEIENLELYTDESGQSEQVE